MAPLKRRAVATIALPAKKPLEPPVMASIMRRSAASAQALPDARTSVRNPERCHRRGLTRRVGEAGAAKGKGRSPGKRPAFRMSLAEAHSRRASIACVLRGWRRTATSVTTHCGVANYSRDEDLRQQSGSLAANARSVRQGRRQHLSRQQRQPRQHLLDHVGSKPMVTRSGLGRPSIDATENNLKRRRDRRA
jgi:hypothetical protein